MEKESHFISPKLLPYQLQQSLGNDSESLTTALRPVSEGLGISCSAVSCMWQRASKWNMKAYLNILNHIFSKSQ